MLSETVAKMEYRKEQGDTQPNNQWQDDKKAHP